MRATCALVITLAFCGAAHAINLGGTDVPKDKFVVFILIGHSNMAGRTSQADSQTHPRLWNYKFDDGTDAWVPAAAPLHVDVTWHKGCGPGMPFLKRLANDYPGYHFGVIQNAHSSTQVQDHYRRGKFYYDEIVGKAKALQAEFTLGGILCMLGRIERNDPTNLATNMAAMVQEFRQDLVEPELPFLVNSDKIAGVQTELVKVPGLVNRSALIASMGPYEADGYHYTYQGETLWANEAVDHLANNGWFPPAADTTPPTIVQVVSQGDSSTVVVSFSEWVSKISAETASNYAIDQGVTVSAAVLGTDSKTVTLTTSALNTGTNYTLTVNGVQDSSPGANTIAANTQATFSYSDQGSALFVVGNTTLNAGDAAVKSRLEGQNYAVTVLTGSAASALDAANQDLVLISSTNSSSSVGTKFRDVAVPVVLWEDYLYDDMGMTGPVLDTDFGEGGGQTQVVIVDGTHAMAAGLSGTVTVTTSGTTFGWGKPGANVQPIAQWAGDATRTVIFGYEAGEAMVTVTAPARRVGLHFHDVGAGVSTVEGSMLFDAAIAWATSAQSTASPQAVISGPASATAGQSALFFGGNSTASGTLTDYSWDFGDGTTAAGQTVNHAWTAAGAYTVSLTVTDELGGSDTTTLDVTVTVPGPLSITLLNPLGGEVWAAGSTQSIQWSVTNVTDIRIDFSTDGGQTWLLLDYSDVTQSSWLNYTWTVPATVSSQCIIMIQDYDLRTSTQSGQFEITSGGSPNDLVPPLLSVAALNVVGFVDDAAISHVSIGSSQIPVVQRFFSADLNLQAGPFTVLATDPSGNQTSRTVTITAQ